MKRNITVLIAISIALIVSLSTTYVMTASGDSDGAFNSKGNNNSNDDELNRNHNQNQNFNGNENENSNRGRRAEVKSSKLKCKRKRPLDCRCRNKNRFKIRRSEDVYAEGEHFPSLSHVDIYVTPNRKWKLGDPIGPDVSTDGVEQIPTDDRGKFPCVKIWDGPSTPGKFDIVVDVNQDGTFNLGDAIDGLKRRAGFKVK